MLALDTPLGYDGRMTTTHDPRGPVRTIKSVEWRSDGRLITFKECEHVGVRNATMHSKPGDRDRCYACGVAERTEQS